MSLVIYHSTRSVHRDTGVRRLCPVSYKVHDVVVEAEFQYEPSKPTSALTPARPQAEMVLVREVCRGVP